MHHLMNRKFLLLAACMASLVGCTTITVEPVPPEHKITSVCIKTNPKVAVSDFTEVLVEGFRRSGIKAKVVSESAKTTGEYTVTYVAYRRWDLAPYLQDATIDIYKNDERIAHGNYWQGFSFLKWRGTASKMNPVIDQMLNKKPEPAQEEGGEGQAI